MTRPAQPFDSQRFIVIIMVHLDIETATFAGLWHQHAPVLINIRIGSTDPFSALIVGHFMGSAKFPHLRRMTFKAVPLALPADIAAGTIAASHYFALENEYALITSSIGSGPYSRALLS